MCRSHRSLALVVAATCAAGGALATERFATPTGSGSACTQLSPCALATAVSGAGAGDTVYLAAGTYTGSGPSVVTITTGIALLGGWDGAATGPAVRDPVAHVSALDGEDARRVVTITGAITATVDGCTITRGNASGLVAGCTASSNAPDGCGGGIFVFQAAVTIASNRITANTAASVSVGAPNGGTGYGGGVYVSSAENLVIRDNVITDNVGSTVGSGHGGGIAIDSCGTGTLVAGNEISGNAATSLDDMGWGGGISLVSTAGVVRDNVIVDNVASAGSRGHGAGLYEWYGTVAIEGNLLIANRGENAAYLGYYGGAFTRNRVISTRAATALRVIYGGTRPVEIDGNVLAHLFSLDGAGVRLTATPEEPLAVTARHNTIVGNGGGIGIYVGSSTTAAFANTILASLWKGAATDEPGAPLTLDRTLFWWNQDDGIRGTESHDGNPNFVSPLAHDYRILPGSAATDLGAATPLLTDLDGEARSLGAAPDLGADEVAPRRFDFGTDTSPLQAGFARVTPATTTVVSPSYGWSAGSVGGRSRGAGTALSRDFNFSRNATFAVALPAGTYDVKVWLGDTGFAHDLMAVWVEGTLQDTVTTAAGEVATRTFRTVVPDGRLEVQIRDGGGSDANAVINALEIAPVGYFKLDFGTAGSPVAPNWLRATDTTAYTPELGAGWLSGAVAARDRGAGSPLTRDLNLTREARFALDLPPDLYQLIAIFGDATYAHDQIGVYVPESFLSREISTAAGEFEAHGFPVMHSSSQLVVRLKDLGGTDANAVINALDVAPQRRLRFDFGTATSPLAPLYARVTPATRYQPLSGFGWLAGSVDARSRSGADPLTRDLNFSRDATFAVDLPDDGYTVSVTVGDAAVAHDRIGIWVENEPMVEIGAVAAGHFVTRSFSVVRVTDGQLTVRLEDRGGTDANAVINVLEVSAP